MEKSNSTANTVLIIILVIIVGFVIWYVTSGAKTIDAPENTNDGPSLEINVGDNQPTPPSP